MLQKEPISNPEEIQKLVSSIKHPTIPIDPGNLICFYEENLLLWNGNDQSLCACSLDDKHNIKNVRIITLTNPPLFAVNSLSLSPRGTYLAISGSNGLMIVELPPNWTFHQSDSNSAPLIVRSTSIGERMFICNKNLRLLCLRWHPVSQKYILLLTNDDCLRLFDIENEFEPIKSINLLSKHGIDLHFERVSIYSNSLGDGAVAFDFGPSLNRYYQYDTDIASFDIYSIYVLRGNGDVLVLYLSLNDLLISNQVFGPLKMTPAAEDNYGSDACSILCLDTMPPTLVIGTSLGFLYHCIVLESDYNEENIDSNELFKFKLSSGVEIIIPECVLYVLETIELSFPLTSSSSGQENQLYNTDELNLTFKLISDVRDPKRYFCLHSFGVHIVFVSFCKQLSSVDVTEYYEDEAIVEYLICTRPTIEQNQQINKKEKLTFPIGLGLFVARGFTYIAVLLNTAELICKRLSNIDLPEISENLFSLKDFDISINSIVNSNDNSNQTSNKSTTVNKNNLRPSFQEHLEKILRRNNCIPLIRSPKGRDSPIGIQELEMLLNSIDVLRKEYLEKFSLAAKAIEQRKSALKKICQLQLSEVSKLRTEKNNILNDYASLVKKCDLTKERLSSLSLRLDKKFAEIQYQRPTLSVAEINLKQELMTQQENIINYKQKLDQIKRKHRYQKAQILKSAVIDETEPKYDLSLYCQMKNIKDMLANQGNEIAEIVSKLNNIKSI
ncbi:Nuclear pore complex protein [Blomia tropicalis]|nr:Nuclear pore complex protein [Blomia tropicalis]